MGGKYDFKRSFYYEAEQSVERRRLRFFWVQGNAEKRCAWNSLRSTSGMHTIMI